MAGPQAHAELMDRVYRWQRHIYDPTRKWYLLGRDQMLRRLDDLPRQGSVLEIGCGTGRNLGWLARRHPQASLYGLDVSGQMLESARRRFKRHRAGPRVRLALADGADFDPQRLFGRAQFDRVILSYSLSMMPQWQRALALAGALVAPGGAIHVVDFGEQHGQPEWLRRLLRAWLARFHVSVRRDLARAFREQMRAAGLVESPTESMLGEYSLLLEAHRPASAAAVVAAMKPPTTALSRPLPDR